jgi:SLT domain-containing protein
MGGSLFGGLLGGTVGAAIVELIGDPTKLKAAFADARATTETETAAMSQSTSAWGASSKAAIAGVEVALGVFAAVSIATFQKHEQIQTQFNVALKDNAAQAGVTASAYAELNKRIEEQSAFNSDAATSAETMLLRFGLTKDQLDQLLPVVADYARATGRDLPDAAQLVGKALLGQARALKSVGVDFHNTGSVAGNFAEIMDKLGSRVSGASAAFLDTTAGSLAKLQVALHETELAAGQGLVPAIGSLANLLTNLGPILQLVGHELGPIVAGFIAFKALTFLPTLVAAAAGAFDTLIASLIPGLSILPAEAAALEDVGFGLKMLVADEGAATVSSKGWAATLAGSAGTIGILIALALALKQAGDNARELKSQDLVSWADGFDKTLVRGRADAEDFGRLLQAMGKPPPGLLSWQGFVHTFEHPSGRFPVTLSQEDLIRTIDTGLVPAMARGLISQDQWNQLVAAAATRHIDLNRRLRNYQEELARTGTSVNAERQAQDAANAAAGAAADAVDRASRAARASNLHRFITLSGQDFGDWEHKAQDAAGGVASALQEMQGANAAALTKAEGDLEKALQTQQGFLDDTRASWRQWVGGIRQDVDFVGGALAGLAGDHKVSAGQIQKAMDSALAELDTYQRNLTTLERRHIPKAMLDQLVNMGESGATVVAGLASANRAQWDHIVGTWDKGAGKSKTVAQQIADALVGAFERVFNEVRAIEGLPAINFKMFGDSGPLDAEVRAERNRLLGEGFILKTGKQHGGGAITDAGAGMGGMRHDEVFRRMQVGEFVFDKPTVDHAGGPAAMEDLRRSLRAMHEGGMVMVDSATIGGFGSFPHAAAAMGGLNPGGNLWTQLDGNLKPTSAWAIPAGVGTSAQVSAWIRAGLALAGKPSSWFPAEQVLVMKESGGSPTIVNPITVLGQHATGFTQMLPSTFAANALPGHGNILNPIDNMAASAIYQGRVYGSPFNIPGLLHGTYHGYRHGGLIDEPIIGFGRRSGDRYEFGEGGRREMIHPESAGGMTVRLHPDDVKAIAREYARLGGGKVRDVYAMFGPRQLIRALRVEEHHDALERTGLNPGSAH